MKAIPFPQANKVLKAPESDRSIFQRAIDDAARDGADVRDVQAKLDQRYPPGAEPEVYDLPVWGGGVEGVERCISCWEPSPEERARIAAGGPVWLWVVGHTHPPLVLDATNPFGQEDPISDNFRDWWLQNGAGIISGLRERAVDIGDADAIALAVYMRLVPQAIAEREREAEASQDQRPTVAESFRELLSRLTLTEEERRIVATARIAASPDDEILLAIIDRLTATHPVSPEGAEDPVP